MKKTASIQFQPFNETVRALALGVMTLGFVAAGANAQTASNAAASAQAAPSSTPAPVPAPLSPRELLAEAEAFAIGFQAYIVGAVYARSQILMEHDIHAGAPLHAPLNQFIVYPGLAKPSSATDTTPNNDTVYGFAWLDLSQGPVLMTIPEVKGRYYTIQATDWALNTMDYVGSRVKSKAGTYAYVPPGWKGKLPPHVTRINFTTKAGWLQARTVVQPEVESDIAPVVAQLKTYQLKPLHATAPYFAMAADAPLPNPKLSNPIWKSIDFYALLNRAWAFGGVREQDRELVSSFAALNIGPGLKFDPAQLSEGQRRGLARAALVGFQRVMTHFTEVGVNRNGWNYIAGIGATGSNRLLASTVGMVGYGGNIADEAIYFPGFVDNQGQRFQGDRRYRLHFAADQLPPVQAFWSITLYSLPDNQLRENPINRYAIGDRTPTLQRNADGSIDIYLQKDSPQADKAGNWLPTGDKGPFWMVLRMYVPNPSGTRYAPPPVERVE